MFAAQHHLRFRSTRSGPGMYCIEKTRVVKELSSRNEVPAVPAIFFTSTEPSSNFKEILLIRKELSTEKSLQLH